MGNKNTEQVKRNDRRKRVRALLPHLDPAAVERLASIDDPLDRFDAIVQAAHDTGATGATVDRCEHARFVYLTSTCGGPEAAARFLYERQPDQPDDRRHRPRTSTRCCAARPAPPGRPPRLCAGAQP